MRYASGRRFQEAGLTSDGGILLLIGTEVIAFIVWFALRDAQGTGEHHPEAHYEATISYLTADAHFDLDVSRHVGHWRIDYFTASWRDKSAPTAPSSL